MSKNFTVQKILGVLLHRLPFILLSGVVAGMIFFIYTSVAIKPVYSTSSMIYIQNYGKQQQQQETTPQDKGEETTAPAATKASSGTSDASDTSDDSDTSSASDSNNDRAKKIFNSDLSGSAALASSCVILFQNDPEVTEMYHGCNVSMSVTDNSFFITINVSGTNAQDCKTTADNVAIRCSEVFNKYFPYGKTGTIRAAGDAGQVSPNKVQNTLVGVAVGLVFAIIVAIMLEMIDTTIKNDDDLAAMYKIPVFAEIPDFENQGR